MGKQYVETYIEEYITEVEEKIKNRIDMGYKVISVSITENPKKAFGYTAIVVLEK